LLSVADFANDANFFFSRAARVVYGFAIATKGSKPYSHQLLCPGAQPGRGERSRNFPKFWTANIELLSNDCHDRVKPIIHSTKLCIAGSFCVRVTREKGRGEADSDKIFKNSGKTARYV